MRSPIPIEPMHLFSHGHLRQRHMARGRVRTNDGVAEKWRLMAASGAQPSPALYYHYRVNLEKNNPELRF